jgi:hypothetical protein
MWDRGRIELEALEVTPQSWLAGWKKRILLDDAVVFGDADALLGCDWPMDGVMDTHFQASRSFELPGVGKRITKEMRRAIPELMRERKASLSLTYSLCVDPEAPKWFRLLGLEEDLSFKGERHGDFVMRRFLRRA